MRLSEGFFTHRYPATLNHCKNVSTISKTLRLMSSTFSRLR